LTSAYLTAIHALVIYHISCVHDEGLNRLKDSYALHDMVQQVGMELSTYEHFQTSTAKTVESPRTRGKFISFVLLQMIQRVSQQIQELQVHHTALTHALS
jgi:hypothetical protein